MERSRCDPTPPARFPCYEIPCRGATGQNFSAGAHAARRKACDHPLPPARERRHIRTHGLRRHPASRRRGPRPAEAGEPGVRPHLRVQAGGDFDGDDLHDVLVRRETLGNSLEAAVFVLSRDAPDAPLRVVSAEVFRP